MTTPLRRHLDRLTLAMSLLAILPVFASTLVAETVILKNGSKIETREPHEIDGDQVVLVLRNGTVSKIPLADVDLEATAAANRPGFGSAQIIEGGEARPIERPPAPKPQSTRSLTDVAAESDLRMRQPNQQAREAVAEPPVARPLLADSATRRYLSQYYATQDFSPRLLENNGPGTATVRLTTDSEAEVFRGLVTTALALLESGEALEQGLAVLELEMRSSDGGQAGDFRITHDRARALREKQITPEEFYVRYVEF